VDGNAVIGTARAAAIDGRRWNPAARLCNTALQFRLPKAPRTDETVSKKRAESSDSDEMRFTTFDFVATALLVLSVFSGPALVWSLLRAVSLG
jgi:hypothetical protein